MVTVTGWGQDLPSACGGSRVRYGVSGQPSSTFNWEVTGGTLLASYNDSADIEWDIAGGIKTIKVTEITQGHCIASPVYAQILVSTVNVNLGNNAELCEGDSIKLEPDGTYAAYDWSTGATSANVEAKKAGRYWLKVTDAYGCKGQDSIDLAVNTRPNVDLGADTSLCLEEKVTFDAGFGGVSYNWSTQQTGQYIEVGPGKQTIWVDVTNEKGCTTRDTVVVDLCRNYKIPNAFTPNGDNDNDTWNIQWLEFYPEATVEIYDRWGRIVFKSKGFPSSGWNGRSNGKPLPMDSYYYVITLQNGIEPIVGNVTIIR